MKFRLPNLLELIIAGLIMILWLGTVQYGLFDSGEIAGGKILYKPLVAESHDGIVTAK